MQLFSNRLWCAAMPAVFIPAQCAILAIKPDEIVAQ